MKIIILALSIWSCHAVRDATSCLTPYVPNAKPAHDPEAVYPNASVLTFVCDKGYKFNGTDSAFCINATWRLPVCKKKAYTCESPARFIKGTVLSREPTQDIFEHRTLLWYFCGKPWQQVAIEYAGCMCGNWTPSLACDTFFTISGSHKFADKEDDDVAGCSGSGRPPATEKLYPCDLPTHIISENIIPSDQGSFKHMTELAYFCTEKCELVDGMRFTTCWNGTWDPPLTCDKIFTIAGTGHPESIRSTTDRKCQTEPHIENGQTFQLKGGMRLSAGCSQLFKLEGPSEIICFYGKWTKVPVCKPPCKLDRTLTLSHQEYLEESKEMTFSCPGAKMKRTVKCLNGNAIYGKCDIPTR
ncbi:complement factor H-like [Clarias gariepinus]|uniref:complement factor H-like n=1 Tax=Clarias gariepinus TaxID=13013 RepID=UPI00234C2715|nr:complement factor H-like [Clarias gariepinus]